MVGYVYIHTNQVNGKKYVGQTTMEPKKRWGSGKLYKSYFRSAILKYGWDNFTHEILEKIENLSKDKLIKDLNTLEENYIKELNTLAPNGYNLKLGGNNSEMSKMTRDKMSKSHTGKKFTDEHKKNMSISAIGTTKRPRTEEEKRVASEFMTNRNLGNKHSEETKQKISERLKGRKMPKKTMDVLRNINSKEIICVETGERYKSITECSSKVDATYNAIRWNLAGRTNKTVSGLSFKYA